MKTTGSNRRLRTMLTDIISGKLEPRPEFQRRLVWYKKHKKAFIKTVLEGLPFPEIYIAAGDVDTETGEGKELLVDGQQRMSTLLEYFRGSRELQFKDIPAYADLDEKDKIDFLEYDVVVRDLGKMDTSEIIEIFKRINSTNYSLNAMEIHNSRYDGAFKQFGDEIAGNNFFEKQNIFTSRDIKRMGDTLFCLNLIVTIMSTYFNRDSEVENYLEKYNEEFPLKDKVRSELLHVFDVINNFNFEPSIRVWKKADLFTLIVELHRLIYKKKLELNLSEVGQKLKDFYLAVEEEKVSSGASDHVFDYYNNALQASNDRSNRIKRGEVIFQIITG